MRVDLRNRFESGSVPTSKPFNGSGGYTIYAGFERMAVGTFFVHSTNQNFRVSGIFNIWLVLECETKELGGCQCVLE